MELEEEEMKERRKKKLTIFGVVDGDNEISRSEDFLSSEVLLDELRGRSGEVDRVVRDSDDQEPRREDGLPLGERSLALIQSSGSLDLPQRRRESVESPRGSGNDEVPRSVVEGDVELRVLGEVSVRLGDVGVERLVG